jgi:hypothetical protein
MVPPSWPPCHKQARKHRELRLLLRSFEDPRSNSQFSQKTNLYYFVWRRCTLAKDISAIGRRTQYVARPLDSLPDEYGWMFQLCHSDPSSKVANSTMLHAVFHTSVIRPHSSAAYPIVRWHIFTPSYTAMQKCLAAVEGLRGIAKDVVNAGMADLLGPPFAFSLWVSVRLLLVHASTRMVSLIRILTSLSLLLNKWVNIGKLLKGTLRF